MSSIPTDEFVFDDPCSVAAAFAAELEMPAPSQGPAPDVRTLDDLGFPSFGSEDLHEDEAEDEDDEDPKLVLCA